ncbi:MAG: HEAT repeat domain-containing protein [Elusimicrobia bacterium]|nr:HEAT repeat domain-containing protein [Elusimicrobiota bacterium]
MRKNIGATSIALLFLALPALSATPVLQTEALVKKIKTADKAQKRQLLRELSEHRADTEQDKRALIDALGDADPEIEIALIGSLTRIKERRAVPKIIADLRHKNYDVKGMAIDALAEIGDEAALAPLEDTLDEQFHFGRPHPIYKFGAKAMPVLIRQANKSYVKQPSGRSDSLKQSKHRSVARAIGEIRDPQAKGQLLPLLKHESPDIRINAAKALVAMKIPEAEPGVELLLSDADPEIKTQAIAVLLSANKEKYLKRAKEFLADPNPVIKGQTADAMGKLKVREVIPDLEGLLTDRSDITRYRAANALHSITGKTYEYAQTRRTKRLQRSAEEWERLTQGKGPRIDNAEEQSVESEAEKREALEKLRQHGLLKE